MSEARTRPISFRVPQDVLDAIEAEGKSPTQIAKAALEREARLARARKVVDEMRQKPVKGRFTRDVASLIREDRDSH